MSPSYRTVWTQIKSCIYRPTFVPWSKWSHQAYHSSPRGEITIVAFYCAARCVSQGTGYVDCKFVKTVMRMVWKGNYLFEFYSWSRGRWWVVWSLVLHCLPMENEYVWVWNSDNRVDTTVSFIHKYANQLSHLFPIIIRAKIAGNTYTIAKITTTTTITTPSTTITNLLLLLKLKLLYY